MRVFAGAAMVDNGLCPDAITGRAEQVMVSEQGKATRVSFGLFEVDLQTGELWKAGRRIRLQSQPFKVLAALLDRPGEVVSKPELQALLWGKDAVGGFDQSLGTAINKIRDALGDTADNPRFVETLARRGYRFIAPVNPLPASTIVARAAPPHATGPTDHLEPALQREPLSPDIAAEAVLPLPESVSPSVLLPPTPVAAAAADPRPTILPPSATRTLRLRALLGPVAAFLLGSLLAWALLSRHSAHPQAPLRRIEQLTHLGKIAPGMPGMESLPASVSDGFHLFVPVLVDGRSVISRVDVHTGAVQPMDLPREVASPMLGDLSPDTSTLLLRNHLSPESEQPLWLAPTDGGSALRLPNVVAHDATWMPDGKRILYAQGNTLIINRPQDGSSTPFATLPGRALWLRWSPDGQLLRFTLLDPLRHTMGLWQLDSDGKNLKVLLKGWDQSGNECCGVWADDGRSFVFQASRDDHTDLWQLEGKHEASPVRITDGPLDFAAPVTSGHGGRIYFLGLETHSQLQRLDPVSSHFVPAPPFLADASRMEYSRDHRSVAWVDQSGKAWRAAADGSERIQLTPDSLQVFLARWSPDGRTIALMARQSGQAWQLYLVPSEGGTLQHLDTGTHNAADPSWSADGARIVFGRVNDVMGDEGTPRFLEILDLRTGTATAVPASTGTFSPRWSPDGHYIAALSLDQNRILLFDVATRQWRTLAQTTAADPVWAADSKALFFHASLAEDQPIYKILIPGGKLQQVATIASFADTPTDYFFTGLSADGEPVVRSRTATGDLYSINLDENKTSPAP